MASVFCCGGGGLGGRGGGLPSVLPTTKNGRVADDAIFKAEDAVASTELQGEGISAARTPQMDTRNRLLQPLEGDAAEHAQENVEEQGKTRGFNYFFLITEY